MDDTTIALASIGISAAVSLIISFLGYKQSFSQNYSGTISNERMEWIKEARKLAAEFLGFCEANDYLKKSDSEKFERLKNEILLNLNSNGNKYGNDAKIRNALIGKDFIQIKQSVPEIRGAFIEIFKNEWDKSKLEAGRNCRQSLMLDIKKANLDRYFKHFE